MEHGSGGDPPYHGIRTSHVRLPSSIYHLCSKRTSIHDPSFYFDSFPLSFTARLPNNRPIGALSVNVKPTTTTRTRISKFPNIDYTTNRISPGSVNKGVEDLRRGEATLTGVDYLDRVSSKQGWKVPVKCRLLTTTSKNFWAGEDSYPYWDSPVGPTVTPRIVTTIHSGTIGTVRGHHVNN